MEESASANASIRNVRQDMALANDFTQMLESSKASVSRKYCCIYRIPRNLRKLNEEAYTPQFISIGPFHYGDKRLKPMEKLKVRYFKRFVKKANLNVKELVSIIGNKEGDVRRCYSETSGFSSDNYVKMILLDASFVIVYFLIGKRWSFRDDDSPVFMDQLLFDMLLLENQLPFFVIEELYNHAFVSSSNYPSFTQLTYENLINFNNQKMAPDPYLKILHFVDLLRIFFLPSQSLPERNEGEKVMHLYTASQLHEAGVKFMAGSSKCLFDLKFTNKVLEIPCFVLYDSDSAESFYRNLMALEQCHYGYDHYFTDYIRVLDFLIDTVKDVDLLVRNGILVNRLGDNNAVTTLVNNLCSNIFISGMNSDYYKLCEKLNSFYKEPCNSWKATLRHDYFSTPWRIASTVAAIILLLLTFIQTVCSIISLLKT